MTCRPVLQDALEAQGMAQADEDDEENDEEDDGDEVDYFADLPDEEVPM